MQGKVHTYNLGCLHAIHGHALYACTRDIGLLFQGMHQQVGFVMSHMLQCNSADLLTHAYRSPHGSAHIIRHGTQHH